MLLIQKHILNLHQRQKLTSSSGRQILFAESGRRKGAAHLIINLLMKGLGQVGVGGVVEVGVMTSWSALLRAPGLRCGSPAC